MTVKVLLNVLCTPEGTLSIYVYIVIYVSEIGQCDRVATRNKPVYYAGRKLYHTS